MRMADSQEVETTRLSQYKLRKTGPSQEDRRKSILQEQQRLRSDAFNEGRNLVVEVSESRPKLSAQRRKRYKETIMLSEWFMDIPSDFQEKWVMVPCPVGKRVLILARRGKTTVFGKDGRILRQFKSNLPGGHLDSGEQSKSMTVLDGIWNRSNCSCYIIDVIAWNNQKLTFCDREFRFYWLQTKLPENIAVLEHSQCDAPPFFVLPSFTCDRVTLEITLSTSPIPDVAIDGFLFYHLESGYSAGRTPLVGWLKPFMIPDVMSISVCDELLVEKPSDYTCHLAYIIDFENERYKKSAKRFYKKYSVKMDVVEAETTICNLQEVTEHTGAGASTSMQEEYPMDHVEEESEEFMDQSAAENTT